MTMPGQDRSSGFAPDMTRPHVVILGAGASRAGFPRGDRNGKLLPVMSDLAEIVGLNELLRQGRVDPTNDFEAAYASLKEDPRRASLAGALEERLRDYFESLRLPLEPTLYDHLLLCLRPKDVIATFNWDPLLVHACVRNATWAPLPRVLFLHGNVGVAVCQVCEIVRPLGLPCAKCGSVPEPVPLLYPIQRKDYSSDPFIAREWEAIRGALRAAYMLTIFGYGAPASDADAVSLLQEGWGAAARRNLEEIEIINVNAPDTLRKTWRTFIHTEHYRTTDSFYSSWIAWFPRRTCEAMWAQVMEGKWFNEGEIESLPKGASWDALRRKFGRLIGEERAYAG